MLPKLCLYLLALFFSQIESSYWIQGENAVLKIDLTNINSYTISIGNETWLEGGEPMLWCNNNWYSQSNTNGYTLTPKNTSPIHISGNDLNLGNWVGLETTYILTSTDTICNNNQFMTTFKYYEINDFFEFIQSFPDGLSKTNITQFYSTTNPMIPLSEFPVFSYSDSSMLRNNEMGYIQWNGVFSQSSHGVGLKSFIGGNENGPIVLFKDGRKAPNAPSMVLSTSSKFMNGIFSIRTRRGVDQNSGCSTYNNVDFEQNDFAGGVISNINSVNECCSVCTNTSYCNVFSYNPSINTCYLKYNDRGKQTVSGHISGTIGGMNSDNGILDYLVAGIQGNLTMIPKNYSISFIISAVNDTGIHGAMYKWGNALKKKYNTTKLTDENDLISTWLGYWTDNGGYYWDGNPLTTNIAQKLFSTFKQNNISIRYLQLDPYWFMGKAPVYNDLLWIPDANFFPNGLNDLYNKINKIPLLLYSFFWNANKTVNYFNNKYNLNLTFQNSPSYFPPWTNHEPIAQPLGYESAYIFYKTIVNQYANIMAGFEIDFMNYNYESFPYEINSYNGFVNQSIQWSKGMNDAIFEYNNISIQYCMSIPSYILQSLQYPSVTNARGAGDGFPNNHNRWNTISYTSLFFSSLNIRTFYDVIWTTSVQVGNTYNVNESDCEMNAIISILSNGPLGIGDGINMTNKTIINRLITSNGILLHPSISITPIDIMYSSIKSFKPSGEIWISYSIINNSIPNGYHIMVIDNIIKYNISFNDLFPMPSETDEFVVYIFDSSVNNIRGQCNNNTKMEECGIIVFNNKQNLSVITSPPPINDNKHLHSWNLYNIVKKQSNGWILLGDMSKYVNISPQRFKSIQTTNNGMKVIVQGDAMEKVIISFVSDQLNILQIPMQFDQNGGEQTIVVS
eukprot:177975_1